MEIPTHLKNCTVLEEIDTVQNYVKANLRCNKHGIDKFEIHLISDLKDTKKGIFPLVLENDQGFFFVVAVKFITCKDQYVLLDIDLHGWNGWVYRDLEQLKKVKPPYKLWECTNCGKTQHQGSVEIFSKGKEDFIAEKDGDFNMDLWYDAFSRFKMNIKCSHCNTETKGFIDYETM